jgi:hypothetical protein
MRTDPKPFEVKFYQSGRCIEGDSMAGLEECHLWIDKAMVRNGGGAGYIFYQGRIISSHIRDGANAAYSCVKLECENEERLDRPFPALPARVQDRAVQAHVRLWLASPGMEGLASGPVRAGP